MQESRREEFRSRACAPISTGRVDVTSNLRNRKPKTRDKIKEEPKKKNRRKQTTINKIVAATSSTPRSRSSSSSPIRPGQLHLPSISPHGLPLRTSSVRFGRSAASACIVIRPALLAATQKRKNPRTAAAAANIDHDFGGQPWRCICRTAIGLHGPSYTPPSAGVL